MTNNYTASCWQRGIFGGFHRGACGDKINGNWAASRTSGRNMTCHNSIAVPTGGKRMEAERQKKGGNRWRRKWRWQTVAKGLHSTPSVHDKGCQALSRTPSNHTAANSQMFSARKHSLARFSAMIFGDQSCPHHKPVTETQTSPPATRARRHNKLIKPSHGDKARQPVDQCLDMNWQLNTRFFLFKPSIERGGRYKIWGERLLGNNSSIHHTSYVGIIFHIVSDWPCGSGVSINHNS